MLFNVRAFRELKGYLGQEIGVSPWMEMTQERIDAFAEVSEDRQWIHVDRARAAEGPPGGRIAATALRKDEKGRSDPGRVCFYRSRR
jgi:acyl dehydratase